MAKFAKRIASMQAAADITRYLFEIMTDLDPISFNIFRSRCAEVPAAQHVTAPGAQQDARSGTAGRSYATKPEWAVLSRERGHPAAARIFEL